MMNVNSVGVSVWGLPDGTSVVESVFGEQFRIGASGEEVGALLARCDGTATIAGIASESDDPETVRDLLQALVDYGCLSTSVSCGSRWWSRFKDHVPVPERISGARVVLVGDAAVAVVLRESLVAAGVAATCVSEDELGVCLGEGGPDLVVSVLAAADHARLLAVHDACIGRGVGWSALVVDRGSGWLGPLVVPGRTADYRDLIDRRKCLVDDPDLWPAQTVPPVWPGVDLPPRPELVWLATVMAIQVTRWIAGADCRLLSTEIEADPVALSLTEHPILPIPVPGRVGQPLTSWTPTPDSLVDPRTGVIWRLRDTNHHESVPSSLHSVQADISNMAHADRNPWQNDLISGGTSFIDRNIAAKASVGEAIERYCANLVGFLPEITAKYADLIAYGADAVDPESLVLYSERQYAQPGFPFVPFTRDLKVRWVKGRNLTKDTDAWLPAGLVYINWHFVDTGDDPTLGFHNYAGVAAGPSAEFAIVSAIEEVVERDAMMTWWSNRHRLPAVELTPELAALWHGNPTRLGQRAWAIHLDNEFDIPVIAGIVENTREQFLTIGFAARPDPIEATRKAWAEAISLQEGSRDLLLPQEDSTVRNLLMLQGGDGDYLKPWRPDRAYQDSYRKDFRDVVQLLCQEQFHLDPRTREHVAPWIDVPTERTYADLPTLPDRTLDTYRRIIEDHGLQIYTADLTTPDIALCGLRIIRVLIPGLAPNFPAAFPTWGRDRIQNHAIALGWRDHRIDEDQLNTFPLPYA